jgi:hypothetical protein
MALVKQQRPIRFCQKYWNARNLLMPMKLPGDYLLFNPKKQEYKLAD